MERITGRATWSTRSDASLAAGLELFDTAEAYGWGQGEQILGALARRRRQPVVIATKYAPLTGRGGVAAIPKGLARSLKRLGLTHVDLYQLHWPDRIRNLVAHLGVPRDFPSRRPPPVVGGDFGF